MNLHRGSRFEVRDSRVRLNDAGQAEKISKTGGKLEFQRIRVFKRDDPRVRVVIEGHAEGGRFFEIVVQGHAEGGRFFEIVVQVFRQTGRRIKNTEKATLHLELRPGRSAQIFSQESGDTATDFSS